MQDYDNNLKLAIELQEMLSYLGSTDNLFINNNNKHITVVESPSRKTLSVHERTTDTALLIMSKNLNNSTSNRIRSNIISYDSQPTTAVGYDDNQITLSTNGNYSEEQYFQNSLILTEYQNKMSLILSYIYAHPFSTEWFRFTTNLDAINIITSALQEVKETQ